MPRDIEGLLALRTNVRVRLVAVERLGHKRSLTGRQLMNQTTELASDDAPIRIDALWMAVEPLDMRTGSDSALERVVAVFGHAYLLANRRAIRVKVLVRWNLLPCDGYDLG